MSSAQLRKRHQVLSACKPKVGSIGFAAKSESRELHSLRFRDVQVQNGVARSIFKNGENLPTA